MARNFVAASSQYLEYAGLSVSARPISVSCWFKQTTGERTLWSQGGSGGSEQFRRLLITNSGGFKIGAHEFDGAGNDQALSTTAITASTWQHAGAVFNGATDRRAYLSGANKGTNATSISPTLAKEGIGRTTRTTPLDYADGDIAFLGVWNVALSDADFTALGAGVSPLLVRPDALVAYWPLDGVGSPEPDVVSRLSMTVTGATQSTTAPILFAPQGARILKFKAPTPVSITANGVPQVASLSTLKGLGKTQSVTANGTPQVVSLARLRTPVDGTVCVMSIGGVTRTSDVRLDSLRITLYVNGQPSECLFTLKVGASFTPTVGMDVQVALGTLTGVNATRVFGGTITSLTQTYQDIQANVTYHVSCQDYSHLLNRRRPMKTYSSSASTIASDLISTYTSGFTSANVVGALATVAASFDGSQSVADALTAIANLVGGYWYVDPAKDLHFFLTETGGPATIDSTNIVSGDGARHLALEQDLTQVRTRIWVYGAGTSCPVSIAAGALSGSFSSVLPVVTAGGFTPSTAGSTPYVGVTGPQLLSFSAWQSVSGTYTTTAAAAVGATSFTISSITSLSAPGWFNIAGQYVFYTTASVLTISGIPASGVGSIVTAIASGSVVTPVDALTVTTNNTYTIAPGDAVTLAVRVDDAAAQTALAALEGGDGIHEHKISNSTLTDYAKLIAAGQADLAGFKTAVKHATYQTRDVLTRPGKSVTFNLAAPTSISVTLTITQAIWTQFGTPNHYPLIEVQASPIKFTFLDVLRKLQLVA